MIENMTIIPKNRNKYAPKTAASIINPCEARPSTASHAGDMKGVHVQQQNLWGPMDVSALKSWLQ